MKRYSPSPTPAQIWGGVYPVANKDAKFSGGIGSKSSPIIIDSAADLAQLSVNVANGIDYTGVYFELACDIYLNANAIDPCLVEGPGGENGQTDYPDTDVHQWTPIGGAGAGPVPPTSTESWGFAGHFDGCCHTIHNAFYNRQDGNVTDRDCNPHNLVGIFGSIWASGSLKNLNTEGGYIAAHISVGGIVGRTWGTIENCHNGNFVYSTGPHGAGGVVGAAYVQYASTPRGTIEARPSIDGCSNCATIVNNYISYNSGKKSGSAGGIVGENEGNIINSWNTGNISCLLNAGGVIGSNQDQSSDGSVDIVPPGYINNCFNWGKVGSYTGCGIIPSTEAIYAGGILAYQTGSCQNVYSKGEVTANGVDNASPARPSAAGQIIGELKAGSGEVNEELHYYSGFSPSIPPVGVVTDGSYSAAPFSNSSGSKDLLAGDLQEWVDENQPGYLDWTQDEDEWPILEKSACKRYRKNRK